MVVCKSSAKEGTAQETIARIAIFNLTSFMI
jgi:hypothetical protein